MPVIGCQPYAPLAPKTDTKTDYSKLSRNQNEACQLFYHLVGTQPFIIRLGNACRGRWRAPHRAPMVVAPPQYIRATPVITRVHQIDQPLAGRLLNGSLSGQISRSGEARGSADVGGSPLSMFDGSIDSPRATRADCRSGLISRLPLLSASASKCEISRSLVK